MLRRTPRGGAIPVLFAGLAMLLGGCGAAGGTGGFGVADNAGTMAAIGDPVTGGVAGSFLAGMQAAEQGLAGKAADLFEQALKADPDNLDLRQQTFILRLADGDFERAGEIARTLLEFDRETDEMRLLFAFEAVRDGDYATAQEWFDRASVTDFTGIALPVLKAWATYGQGDVEGALAQLAEAGRNGGPTELATFHAMSMLVLQGRFEEADAQAKEVFGDGRDAPFHVLRLMGMIDVELDRAGVARDRLLTRIDETPRNYYLRDDLDAIVSGKLAPPPITGPASGMAKVLVALGRALSSQRAANQAMVFARLATYLDPTDGETWMLVGDVALQQGNPEATIRAMEKVDPEDPASWEAGLLEAQALQSMERDEEALALLRSMVREHEDRLEALVAIGDSLRRQERFREAEKAYDQAISHLDEPSPADWRMFYVRGITRERTDRWDEAEADFLKALELAPDQPFVLNYLGYSWVDKGMRLQEAEAMLQRAVELRPDDGFVIDSLGWAYYRLGRFDLAVEYLERAVELEPGDPVINDHLGDAYWRAGRRREARFQWERALTFSPEEDLAREIGRKLENGLGDATADRG